MQLKKIVSNFARLRTGNNKNNYGGHGCNLRPMVVAILQRRKRKRRPRSIREKEWLKRRLQLGVYREILEELRLEDAENYRKYLRMNVATFEVMYIKKVRKTEIQSTCPTTLPISISKMSTCGL